MIGICAIGLQQRRDHGRRIHEVLLTRRKCTRRAQGEPGGSLQSGPHYRAAACHMKGFLPCLMRRSDRDVAE